MSSLESRDLSRGAAYYGLAVVTVLNFLNYIDRYILAAVLPRVQSELALTDFQAGLLAPQPFAIAHHLLKGFMEEGPAVLD